MNQYEWRPINSPGLTYFQLRKINDANSVFTDLLKVQNTGQLDVTGKLSANSAAASSTLTGNTVAQVITWLQTVFA